jgi:hypothetical protein
MASGSFFSYFYRHLPNRKPYADHCPCVKTPFMPRPLASVFDRNAKPVKKRFHISPPLNKKGLHRHPRRHSVQAVQALLISP